MLLHAVIFVSGGAILALELLASRIMTPYFGVSLYIWTGILSITLIALALGYWFGGKIANRSTIKRSSLIGLYALMPAIAAIAIVAACLIYPFVFASLAGWSLVGGAFVACLILLSVPLIATSAMNPLLVALLRHEKSTAAGDGGAGMVFFVSTVGSVAGVLVTAFGLIPFLSNYSAVLLVAAVLSTLSIVMALMPPSGFERTGSALTAGAVGLAAALLLCWQADAWTGRANAVSYQGRLWRVETVQRSLFGTVKILRSESDADNRYTRLYFHDGLTQNAVESNGQSRSFYTWALEALALAYRPDSKHALALGLGAGMVPQRLAAHGINTEVVEIDPSSIRVAGKFFGFDATKVHVHQTDARTFVQSCPRAYDVIVVDLFHGDGTPDYLITRDFFRGLKQCLAKNGVAVFNTFADLERPLSYAHLLTTLRAELPHLALYRPNVYGATHTNSFIVAGADVLPAPAKITIDDVPSQHTTALWDMLAAPMPRDEKLYAGGKIITDAWNPAALELANTQLAYRQTVVRNMPAQFLLN